MGESVAVVISTFYRFAALPDFRSLREPLREEMLGNDVRGTVLLAAEGINGTVAGPRAEIDAVLGWIRGDSRLAELRSRESCSGENPFYRTRVKLKKEIVTMGAPDIDPRQMAGTYVTPEQWNELIDDPEVLVLDTRNQYEIAIGTFRECGRSGYRFVSRVSGLCTPESRPGKAPESRHVLHWGHPL